MDQSLPLRRKIPPKIDQSCDLNSTLELADTPSQAKNRLVYNISYAIYSTESDLLLLQVLAEYHIKTKKISEEGDATTNSFLARNE